jgi:hypothetical protein
MHGGRLTALDSALHPEKSVTRHPKPHFSSPALPEPENPFGSVSLVRNGPLPSGSRRTIKIKAGRSRKALNFKRFWTPSASEQKIGPWRVPWAESTNEGGGDNG